MNHVHRWRLPSPEDVDGPLCTGQCACGATLENQRLAASEWDMRDRVVMNAPLNSHPKYPYRIYSLAEERSR